MKQTILLLVVTLFLTSCDGFLQQDPIDQLGEGSFYTNDDELDMAMVACYNGLQGTMQYEWLLTEVRTDNSRIYSRSTTSTSSKNVIACDHLTVPTTHEFNEQYWEAVYHNIANCNTVIQNLGVVVDADLRNQLEGEALFLRAYHYFNLVRLYGPIFKVTERISVDDANTMEKTIVDDIYSLTTADLLTAVELLPSSYEDESKGRATSWAAKTLLAKVYLHLGEYAQAETLLLDVEANSGYQLLSSYADVFDISNEMNDEILFAVQYLKGGYGIGSPFANFFAPNGSQAAIIAFSGNGYNCPSMSLINAYETADQRKDVTLSATYVNEQGSVVQQAWAKKYFSEVSIQYDAENDWPIIRFADVYLMLAETKLKTSSAADALPYINYTRVRAGLSPLVEADIPDRLTAQLAVEEERRLEFALENHRFFDLVRNDRFITVMNEHFETEVIQTSEGGLAPAYTDPDNEIYMTNRVIEEWQLLLPIPYSVLTVATQASQNPGY